MIRKDQFDDFAELCVFGDDEFRAALERGDDGELCLRLGKLAREHFAHGHDRLARSSDPLDGLDSP
jgi:hypothetical protein